MSMEDINNAAQSLNEAAAAYHGKIGEIDQTVNDALADMNAKKIELDGRVDAMFLNIARGRSRVEYDNSIIHSKSSLNLPVDPNFADRTEWGKITAISNRLSAGRTAANGFCILDTQSAITPTPGYYENPQWSSDISRGTIEVILTEFSTHADIQAYLDANPDFQPRSIGGQNSGAFNYDIPSTTDSYANLRCRFVNRRYDNISEGSGQDISTFGGNPGFQVNAVSTFQK